MNIKEYYIIPSTIEIFNDVIAALDEVIVTYNYLSKIEIEDNRPNQLLFCHVVNSFDSFIKVLTKSVILTDFDKLKQYYYENGDTKKNSTIDQVIDINILGINVWMIKSTQPLLDTDIRQKRHAQIIKLLLNNTNIDYENIFILLSGQDKIGTIKKKPVPSKRTTISHKTTSEELIGYADILYEKRNAITHNNNCYKENVIQRLNETWSLQITKSSVLIRQETIKAVIRFYTSVCLKLLNSDIFEGKKDDTHKNITSNIKTLQQFKNINKTLNPTNDPRYKSGGIEGRKITLRKSKKTEFSVQDYLKITNISPVTAQRDFAKLKKEKFIKLKKRGIWELTDKPNEN